ncbi:MAG TPA: type IV pilus secretin PilQ [Chromatiales bacterium]|nr:type IV pilus secretin PilQ [Chromatiales bacterium]
MALVRGRAATDWAGRIPGFSKRAVGLLGLFALFLLSPALSLAAPVLQEVTYSALPGEEVQLVLNLSEPVAQPGSFSTDSPARIVLDFKGVSSALARKTQNIGIGAVQRVTAVEAGGRTRVVITLSNPVPYEVKVQGKKVFVDLKGQVTPGAVVAAKAAPVAKAGVSADRAQVATGKRIENIDFRRGAEGQGRVVVKLTDPATVVDVREEGKRVILNIIDTQLPDALRRKLDVVDFATPVTTVEARQRGRNAKIDIVAAGEYEYMAYQANELFTVELRPLSKAEKEARKKEKLVYTGERLSLNFQDIEVRAVLQLLADFTGLNLVTSDTVTGRITLRLKNVPWDQALDIILKTKGLSMRRTENVIMVAPTEELAAREKLELESKQQIEELAPLRSEFIQINYAKATDLAALLKSEENRLLSERGNVTIDERTNTLLVQDTAAKLEDIRRIIKKLDIPVRQVLIEARIVVANNDFSKDLGVRFGFTKSASSGNTDALLGGGVAGHLGGTFGLDKGTFMGTGAAIEQPGGSGNEALMVNLPVTAPSGAANFLIGKVGSYLLQLELSAMQKEGKGEIVSSPRVITADQNRATIKQGVEIPYQEASASGATTVSFKEAVLKLDVTPHITPDDRILMDLKINKDNADFSRSVLGVPPLDTRKIETAVLVDNGETVVLGGVYERTKTTNSERVPFFGDLPYVGVLFKRDEQKDENKELLIFITPKILKESLGIR